jgi:imidazolonepropionase-like amidohydrolase
MAQFSAAELRAAVDEALRFGLPITTRVHATQAIADAVAAGVDGMEHVSFWSAHGVDEPGD